VAAKYLLRAAEPRLRRLARQFPALLLTGPRQSGKTTTLRKLFPKHRFVSLDDPVLRLQAHQDPELFLDDHPPPLLLDEIQYAPQLLPVIKLRVDRSRRQNGAFILTGSQMFPLMAGVSESLAGRVGIAELLPMTVKETRKKPASVQGLFQQLIRGFFPDVVTRRVDASEFYSSYLQTYLERDIRMVRAVQDLRQFQSFLQILAANIGNILDLSKAGAECGVTHTTAAKWLSVLEGSRIVFLLPPFSTNIRKRVVRRPKIFFSDTGLVCHLVRERDEEALRRGPLGGAIFENFIVAEALKHNLAMGSPWALYFYRDNNRKEVDLIIDAGQRKLAVEIKLSKTPTAGMAKDLELVGSALHLTEKILVSNRREAVRLTGEVTAIHWADFLSRLRSSP
jgi:uncharacterized protein